MKVDNPRFNSANPGTTVTCHECPFADEDGFCEPGTPLYGLCNEWGRDHLICCPTAENYDGACKMAEVACEAAKEEP